MTRLRSHGAMWVVHPEWATRLEAVLAAPGRVVKESPDKRVDRCEVEGVGYFRKVYRHGNRWFRPWKYYFKSSPARQEWDMAAAMAARGVSIVDHCAMGERFSWRGLEESVLITQEFPGAPVTLKNHEEAAAVLKFLEHMHDAGVIQHDLHGANLLIHPATGEVRLVDLYGSEIKGEIPAWERDRNLAELRMTLPVPVSEPVARLSGKLRSRTLAKRSKRAWKHNREFAPVRMGSLTWHVRLPWWNDSLMALMRDPERFLERDARSLKRGRSSTVGMAGGLVLKRYNFKKPLNLVKDLFRPSRGARAFRQAYHLELAGVRTALPIAMATRRVLGLKVCSYFVMGEIRGARELGLARDIGPGTILALAELLGRLHGEGFAHRDLKASNLVCDDQGHWHLIDLEGLKFARNVSAPRAWADLERLWRSAAERLPLEAGHARLFLRNYCRARGLRPGTFRDRGARRAGKQCR